MALALVENFPRVAPCYLLNHGGHGMVLLVE
jgi:hypothetical protein